MALDWLKKVRSLAQEYVASRRQIPPANGAYRPSGPYRDALEEEFESTVAEPPSWTEVFVRAIPVFMAVVGCLLTFFTEMIGAWAMLGYLLLVVAPIVYWLQRIEGRLAQIAAKKPEKSSSR
jgi:hypothetical protein